MAHVLYSWGWLAILSGVAFSLPVGKLQFEGRAFSNTALAVLSVSALLIFAGMSLLVMSYRKIRAPLPSGARIAIVANALMISFCLLELGDRLVARQGQLVYWSTFLLLPALLLYAGLVLARPWAWRVARGAAALAVFWFLGFIAILPLADLRTEGVPVPWYGRIYMAGVSLFFAAVMAAAYRMLGQRDTTDFFRRSGSTFPSA